MERRIFVVLVLMAAVAAYGSDGSVRLVNFDAQHFVGPVCYPGDPCGWPGVVEVNRIGVGIWGLNGPVCYPGDPCGPWPGGLTVGSPQSAWIVEQFNGPMCMPGDPCGSGTIEVGSRINFGGPMCFPGDPCGPGGVRVSLVRDAWGGAKFNGPMCMPGDPCGPGTTAELNRMEFAGPMCFPGDPCGLRVGVVSHTSDPMLGLNLVADGPVCLPHEVCGPQRTVIGSRPIKAHSGIEQDLA